MKKTKRIMDQASRSAARASRVRTAMCSRNEKCVAGRNLVSATHNSVTYQ